MPVAMEVELPVANDVRVELACFVSSSCVVGDYMELGVGFLDVPGMFLLLGLFEFLVVSGRHLVAYDFVGDYVLFLGDSWLGLLVLELMVMPNYLLALLEFGVYLELSVGFAVPLKFFVSLVEVGSGRGACHPAE